MSRSDTDKWNTIHQSNKHHQQSPAKILVDYEHLLPESGSALDIACGIGANAIRLAQHGLETAAWDISEQAINKLDEYTYKHGLVIKTEVRDVVSNPPEKNSFDVIIICHFLDRQLIPDIKNALCKDGLLYYQTFIRENVDNLGPSNPCYRFEQNELLQLCNDLNIILYREEGKIGNVSNGFRNEVMLIGQRT